ncbi:MAG: ATP-binding protein [Planctomycetota bacterium]
MIRSPSTPPPASFLEAARARKKVTVSSVRPVELAKLPTGVSVGAVNALKFTDEGTIAVGIRSTAAGEGGYRFRIDVADMGIGMTPEQLGRVQRYDPFVQADSTHTRRFGGTGFGLSISRSLSRSRYAIYATLTLSFSLMRNRCFRGEFVRWARYLMWYPMPAAAAKHNFGTRCFRLGPCSAIDGYNPIAQEQSRA